MIKKPYIFIALGVTFLLTSCSKPIADFRLPVEKQHAPGDVKFTNTSKKATTYEWDFGDGNTSDEEHPTHTYLQSGNYEVTLKVMDDKNKADSEMKRISITPPEPCLVVIHTEFGDMTVKLSNLTPKHRDNFYRLADKQYYDDLLFHRVINGFMIQGGDPHSRNAKPNTRLGGGGPEYTVPAEFNEELVHVKGALAAARMGDVQNPHKASSGSQFYIVHGKPLTERDLDQMERRNGLEYSVEQRKNYLEYGGTPFLDGEYTVFGHVIDGMEVIDKIAATQTQPGDRPTKDVKMKIQVIK